MKMCVLSYLYRSWQRSVVSLDVCKSQSGTADSVDLLYCASSDTHLHFSDQNAATHLRQSGSSLHVHYTCILEAHAHTHTSTAESYIRMLI